MNAPERAPRGGELLVFLGGDVMTGRGVDQALAHPSSPELHESWVRDAREYLRLAGQAHGPVPAPVAADYVWGAALADLERVRPDLRIVNLETAVTRSDRAAPAKGIHYRMHPANLDCLRAARLDCCVLANNHVLDWGLEGLSETLQVLHASGIATAGAGEDIRAALAPASMPLDDGSRVRVFGLAAESSGVPSDWAATTTRSGVALLREPDAAAAERFAAHVAAHRRPNELTIVSIHWGGNWGLQVPQAHREFARRLVELGAADVVHGHSSHHPLPIEIHRGKLILYGCGDLLNDYEGIGPRGELRPDLGCLYFATLERESGRLQQVEIVVRQLRRLRLDAPDAEAVRWLAGIFDASLCTDAVGEPHRLQFALDQNTLRWRR